MMTAGRKPFAIAHGAGHLKTLPAPPEYLTPAAVAILQDVGQRMVTAGLLAEFDLPTLANYCCALARVAEAEKLLAANGLTVAIRNDKGAVTSLQVAPEHAVSLREREAARRLASELGLSPTARAKIAGRDEHAGIMALLAPEA